jgi:predicted RND superfamily exporter protein
MRHDRWLNLGCCLFVLVLFRWFFGRWRGGILVVGSLVVTGILLFGAMSLAGTPIDLLSNILFILLTAATLEDFLFVSHLRRQGTCGWRLAFAKLVTPGFLTSLTTVIGFGSLCLTDLPPLRRFGAWSAAGALLEWAVVFFALPAFIRLVPYFSAWTEDGRGARSPLAVRLARRTPPRLLARGALVAFAAALVLSFGLKFDDAPTRTFPVGHPHVAALSYLRQAFGFQSNFYVVFPDARQREANQAAIDEIRRQPNVDRVVSGYDHRSYLAKDLAPDLAAMVLRDFAGTDQARGYFARSGEMRAIVFVKDPSIEATRPLVEAVERACDRRGCYAAGDLISYFELANRVVRTLLESIGVSAVLVTIMLIFIAYQLRQRHYVALALSALWGTGMSLGLFSVLRLDMNFVTAIFATVLIAMAGDNAIQYLFSARRAPLAAGIDRLGGASWHLVIVMSACMGLFGLSAFRYPRVLGAIFVIGFVLSYCGDLWLLKGLIAGRRDRRTSDV